MPSGYGVPTDASGAERLPWSWAAERLAEARNYWICTARGDGRPHAVPVWGLWLDDALWFSTSRASQKARNLERDPRLVVHLESGDDVVILEGVADVATEGLTAFVEAYDAKYAFRPDPNGEGSVVYVVRPRVAQSWRERDFPQTAARWVFDG